MNSILIRLSVYWWSCVGWCMVLAVLVWGASALSNYSREIFPCGNDTVALACVPTYNTLPQLCIHLSLVCTPTASRYLLYPPFPFNISCMHRSICTCVVCVSCVPFYTQPRSCALLACLSHPNSPTHFFSQTQKTMRLRLFRGAHVLLYALSVARPQQACGAATKAAR